MYTSVVLAVWRVGVGLLCLRDGDVETRFQRQRYERAHVQDIERKGTQSCLLVLSWVVLQHIVGYFGDMVVSAPSAVNPLTLTIAVWVQL